MAPRSKKTALTIIRPGDEGYLEQVNSRGKHDVVSPELNPVIEEMLKNGEREIQLPDGKPFTVSQIRYWAPKATARLCPDDKRISVAGGKGKNISISIREVKPEPPKTKLAAKRRPVKKPVRTAEPVAE